MPKDLTVSLRMKLEHRVKNDRLKMKKIVTIIIKERLLSRKPCKTQPVRVVLFFTWRELPIQDD